MPDNFYKVSGSPYCAPDRYGVSGGKSAISGNVYIGAGWSPYDANAPCPVKKVEADGTACFDPEAWRI